MSVETKRQPKYLKAKDILRERIADKTYTDAKPVPPEKVLAVEFNMAPMTVRRAMQELVDEGVLVRQRGRGKGTYVRPDPRRVRHRVRKTGSSEKLKRVGAVHEYDWLHVTGSPVYFKIFMAVQAECARRGVSLDFLPHEAVGNDGGAGLKKLAEEHSAQVVVVLDWHRPEDLVELQEMGVPVVVPGSFQECRSISWVAQNDFQSSALVTRYLLSLGHSRVGLINTRKINKVKLEREAGWLTAQSEAGIYPDSLPRYYCGRPSRYASQQFEELKSELLESFRKEPPPTALLAKDGLHAWAAVQALRELGLHCPEDVSVGCPGSFYRQAFGMPDITSAAPQEGELGERVLDLAEQLLNGSGTPGMGISIPAYLIKGQTSAPPKKKAGHDEETRVEETAETPDNTVTGDSAAESR
jgi:DNA-binding LacI/PurR family transcriptional regulator